MESLTTHRLGRVQLEPQTDVIAGRYGTWTLRYTVGRYGIDSGGQIKIAFPLVTDWEVPQFDQPTQSGYTTITTNGAAKLRVSWQPKGYVRPWSKCIVIDVYDGSLDPDSVIKIVLGDTAQGSPGMRAQTYQESKYIFLTLIDPTNGCDPRPIPTSPQIRVVPDVLESIVCLLPSQAKVGEPVDIFVKGEDHWRNPTPPPTDIQFEWVGTGTVKIDNGQLVASGNDTGYVVVTAGELTCRSNPLQFTDADIPLKKYWGDLHAQTKATVGTGTEDEYFTFGRDVARLDFTSHQGNDFQITDDYWQHLNDSTKRYHEDGRFVVFPGYEWSANSPAGGDLNVFYRREGQPILRSSHWLVPHIRENDLTPAHPADVLFEKMKQTVPLDNVLLCAHVGGRYANIRQYFDQDLFGLVELVSCWGMFEWMLWDAIERDYIVGVMCNSDGHHGRPGAEGAGMEEFGIQNGLTCVLSPTLTRDAVFDALKQRHCYGTTGARILLDFAANDQLMGSVIANQQTEVVFNSQVVGTAPLEAMQLYRGKALIHEVRPSAFDTLSDSHRIRISWCGSRERGRQRRVTWDGEIRFTDCRIQSVEPFAFDTELDGIIEQSDNRIAFRSRTTGDRDGFDIWLDDARNGQVVFDSAAGQATLDLNELSAQVSRKVYDFGGVDMQVVIERYPEQVTTLELDLTVAEIPPAGKLTPYFVKVIQVDGQMAWSSPIYFDNRTN